MKKLNTGFNIDFFRSHYAFSQDESDSKLLKQFHAIQSEEMMTWMQKLCSPEFNGRLAGTPEFIASADGWLEN